MCAMIAVVDMSFSSPQDILEQAMSLEDLLGL